MSAIIQIFCIVVILILLVKLWKPFVALIKGSHGLYKVFISPFQKFIQWEWMWIKIIIENIKFERPDIFVTLGSSSFVGRVFNLELPQLRKNRVFKAIFILGGQVALAGIILHKSGSLLLNIDLYFTYLINNLVFAFCGLFVGVLWFELTKNKVLPEKNVYISSTLGMEINPMSLELLNDRQIETILKWIRYEGHESAKLAAIKRQDYCYPSLYAYFQSITKSYKEQTEDLYVGGKFSFKNVVLNFKNFILKLTRKENFSNVEVKMRHRDAFVALISFLNLHRDIKATVAATGHGGGLKHGLSVLEHTLNTAEQCLTNHKIIIENVRLSDKDKIYLKDVVVLAALAHDIGKVKCWIDQDRNEAGNLTYRKHHQNGTALAAMIKEIQELDLKTRDYLLDSIYFADKTDVGDDKTREPFFKDKIQSMVINMVYSADIQASEREGVFYSEESILHEYRQKILMALREPEKMRAMSFYIKNHLYINANLFIDYIFHLTGQNTIKRDYTQDPVFRKMILPILSNAGLIDQDGLEIINKALPMVFLDSKTGKQIAYFQKVLMLNNVLPESYAKNTNDYEVAYVDQSDIIVRLILHPSGKIQEGRREKRVIEVTEDWEQCEVKYQQFLRSNPGAEVFLDPLLASRPEEMIETAIKNNDNYNNYLKDGSVMSHEQLIGKFNIQRKILLPENDSNDVGLIDVHNTKVISGSTKPSSKRSGTKKTNDVEPKQDLVDDVDKYIYVEGVKLVNPDLFKGNRRDAIELLNEYLILPSNEQPERKSIWQEEQQKFYKRLHYHLLDKGLILDGISNFDFENLINTGTYTRCPVDVSKYKIIGKPKSNGTFLVYLYESPTIKIEVFDVESTNSNNRITYAPIVLTGFDHTRVQALQELKLFTIGEFECKNKSTAIPDEVNNLEENSIIVDGEFEAQVLSDDDELMNEALNNQVQAPIDGDLYSFDELIADSVAQVDALDDGKILGDNVEVSHVSNNGQEFVPLVGHEITPIKTEIEVSEDSLIQYIWNFTKVVSNEELKTISEKLKLKYLNESMVRIYEGNYYLVLYGFNKNNKLVKFAGHMVFDKDGNLLENGIEVYDGFSEGHLIFGDYRKMSDLFIVFERKWINGLISKMLQVKGPDNQVVVAYSVDIKDCLPEKYLDNYTNRESYKINCFITNVADEYFKYHEHNKMIKVTNTNENR